MIADMENSGYYKDGVKCDNLNIDDEKVYIVAFINKIFLGDD